MALKRGMAPVPNEPPDTSYTKPISPVRVYLDDLDILVETLETAPWNCQVAKSAGSSTTWDNAVEDLPRANNLELRNIQLDITYKPSQHSAACTVVIELHPESAEIRTRDVGAYELVDSIAEHIHDQWQPSLSRAERPLMLLVLLGIVTAAALTWILGIRPQAEAAALLASSVTMLVLLTLGNWIKGPASGARVIRASRDRAEERSFQKKLAWAAAAVALVSAGIGALLQSLLTR